MKINVGIYTSHTRKGGAVKFYAYPDRRFGLCNHEVEAQTERQAKAAAIAEHKAKCLKEDRS